MYRRRFMSRRMGRRVKFLRGFISNLLFNYEIDKACIPRPNVELSLGFIMSTKVPRNNLQV